MFFLERSFHLMRTREIFIQPEECFTETLLWNNLSGKNVRYWPLLVVGRKAIEEKIEKTIPVKLDFSISGFGRFRIGISPLKPVYIVRWKKILWYVAQNGKIWETSRPFNDLLPGITKPDGPVFEIGAGFPPPLPDGAFERRTDTIYRSLLPMDLMKNWKDEVLRLPWYSILEKLVIQKRAGEYYLVLLLNCKRGPVELLLRADSGTWPGITEALGKIMPGFPEGYKDIYIDATYKDKIVVKDLNPRLD